MENFFLNPVYSDWLEHSKYWAFPVEDINGNFQGDRVKVVGIPGGKNVDFQRGQCKKVENSRGVIIKMTGNPGGSISQKNDILNRRVQFFSGKTQWISLPFSILTLFSL